MALDVGTLVANLVVNSSDFDRGVDRADKRFGSLGSKLGGAAKGIGVAVATGLAVAGAAAATGAVALYGTGVAIDALGKKAATVFGPELGKAQQWAAQNAEAMGLTRSQAVGLAAGFGDLLVPMGFTREQATKMSTDVIGLSGALSEWSGGQKSAAEVSGVLAKAMLGEREGLKELGISITEADVKARLAANGTDRLTGSALEQAKALATQQLIMAKSTDAQAAYAKGAEDPIRKQAQLKARALEVRDAFATALLPASNAVVGGLLQLSEGALPKVEAGLASATAVTQQFIAGLSGSGVDALGRPLEGAAAAGVRAHDMLVAAGAAASGFWRSVQDVDLTALREGLSGAGDASGGVVTTLGALGALLPSVGTLVRAAGDAVGFLADHSDTLVKYMPLLIGAFVAYKAAQTASNIAALAGLPIQAATVVANFAAASANRALAVAIGQQTAIQNANAVATTRGTLATIAGTVAGLAASAAAKGMTAAQWLLNAALTANPIGLVVLAIAALVGALVLAWQHSETFRNVVKGAMEAVGAAVRFLVDNVVRPYLTAFITVWSTVATGILSTAARVASALGMDALADKLRGAAGAVEGFARSATNALNGIPKEFDIKVFLRTEGMRDAAAAARNASRSVGDGPGRGGKALARVSAAIAGTGAYVTSTYRTPARNRAVGGSPTSHHLDAANPAVDIGGSRGVLNSVASKLRSMGGWRELIWQAPGHYDHIHAADMGGVFQGPGYVWMGAGQETFASGLAARKLAELPAQRTPGPGEVRLSAEDRELLMAVMDRPVRLEANGRELARAVRDGDGQNDRR